MHPKRRFVVRRSLSEVWTATTWTPANRNIWNGASIWGYYAGVGRLQELCEALLESLQLPWETQALRVEEMPWLQLPLLASQELLSD